MKRKKKHKEREAKVGRGACNHSCTCAIRIGNKRSKCRNKKREKKMRISSREKNK